MKEFDLDEPLFEWKNGDKLSQWTIGDSFMGTAIFGSNGSGKSSGSAAYLAKRFLRHGYGGIVLSCKNERETWEKYCEETGRTADLIILEPGGEYRFDFMEYLTAQADNGNAITENLVETLKTVIQAGEEKSSGKTDDPFWAESLTILISSVIDLCMLVFKKVGIQLMYDIAQTLPDAGEPETQVDKSKEIGQFEQAFSMATDFVTKEVHAWYKLLSPGQLAELQANGTYDVELLKAIPNARLLKMLGQFFFVTFKNLSSKTKSVILLSFSSFLFKLLREPIYSMFCGGVVNIRPEDCLVGKIILLHIPVKLYHNTGRDCQIMFKHLFQMAMEKRDVKVNGRPVMIFADESQFFTTENDQIFQATARSSRVATVYITQNLQQYYASMGGAKFLYRVKSLLGTLNTKIFHTNADYETNEYASQLIGDAYVEDISDSMNFGKEVSHGNSKSYKLERLVRPEEFMTFKCGGTKSNFYVEGILHMQGPPIMNGLNFKRMSFNQLK